MNFKEVIYESTCSSLLDLLKQLEKENPLRPQVVLEATGNYSKPLVSFFSSHGYPVIVLNPLHTHQMKKKSVRQIKTDPVDAMRIAQVFYLGQSTPQFKMDDQVYELRTLCRQYNHWKGLYSEVQLHFRSVLDLLFPGYDKVFHKICNLTSLRLLASYPTPKSVLSADRDELLQILLNNRRGQSWNESKLDFLITTARESLPNPQGQCAHQSSLLHYIKLLNCYQECISDIERQMIALAESLPVYTLLRTIPGVGPSQQQSFFLKWVI